MYDDVRAAELKEMEIPFKWNELAILTGLCIVCCENMENMLEEQLNSNLSPPPTQNRHREITIPGFFKPHKCSQDLCVNENHRHLCSLGATLIFFLPG